MNAVVLHYQEIALKGRNRPWFVDRLVRNLRTATADLDVKHIHTKMGRIEMALGPDTPWDQVSERLRRVFGVANFSRDGHGSSGRRRPRRFHPGGARRPQSSTFRVSARRANKRFPLTSPEIEREVGGHIKEARGWKVDLSNRSSPSMSRRCRATRTTLGKSGDREECQRASAAASCACCLAASTPRSRPTA